MEDVKPIMTFYPQSNKQLKGGKTMLQKLKIALLIVILAEEIRNARNYKKAIGKKFVYPKKRNDGIRLIRHFNDFR